MTITQDLQASNVTSPYIEMLKIDGSAINSSLVFNFTASSDEPFAFGGVTFQPMPIQLSGTEVTTGQPPRPKLVISNITKLIQPYIQQYQGMKGVKVTRVRTLAKFLDGQPLADSGQYLPPEVYYINAMTRLDRTSVEFELVTALDLPNAKLPAAQALKDNLGTNDMYAPGLSIIRFRG